MKSRFREYILQNKLIEPGDSIVIGVSGGADSVCLLSLLNGLSSEMDLTLVAVYVNHGVRGQEAEDDGQFVKSLCTRMDVAYRIFSVNAPAEAEKTKRSVEEAGRILRYEIFEEVRRDSSAGKIAVAHNKNDSAETVLFNLFRGTGIKGMTGIRPLRDKIIRPLLFLERGEIEEYLNQEGLDFRTDRTNLETEYIRNKIRLKLLPVITEEINAQVVGHIAELADDINELEEYLTSRTKRAYSESVEFAEGTVFIKKANFEKQDKIFQNRIIRSAISELTDYLKDISRRNIEEVSCLFEKEVGKKISLPNGLQAQRTYEGIKIHKSDENKAGKPNAFCLELDGQGEFLLGKDKGKITIRIINEKINIEKLRENHYTKYFDYDKIRGNLHVRSRQEGDYFTINPDNKRKKIKTYFIDCKVPRQDRESVLLLAKDSHILWIIGRDRVSEFYKVTENTNTILEVKYTGGYNERKNQCNDL